PSVSIYSHAAHRDLHSFPTRRSSDLALGVDLANADIAILGRDIEVAHDRHRLIRGETLLQQRLQVGVELGLGWKLHRMVAAFALGKIAVHDGHRLAVGIGEAAPDKALLRVFTVTGKALVDFQRRLARQQGDTVMTFLAVVMHVVAECFGLCQGELLVGDLGFLQADDIRLMLFDDRRQLVRSCPQSIDIERNKFHQWHSRKSVILTAILRRISLPCRWSNRRMSAANPPRCLSDFYNVLSCQARVDAVLAFRAMRISFMGRFVTAGLALLVTSSVFAARLEVNIEPSSRALRENVENHIGDLGDRDERELLRYSRIAQQQAEKALQALGYYNATIESEVLGGEESSLVLRIVRGEPVRLRDITVRVDGPAAQLSAFEVPRNTLKPGDVLHHGRYEEV